MGKRIVCFCNYVEEKELTDLLNKGVDSVDDLQRMTRAGTSCGRCLPVIDDLVRFHKKNKPKDQQMKLDFGL